MKKWIKGLLLAGVVGVMTMAGAEAAPRTYDVNGVTVSLIEDDRVYGKGFELFTDFAFTTSGSAYTTSTIYNEAGSTTLGGTPIYVGDIIASDGTQAKQFYLEVTPYTSGSVTVSLYGAVGTATKWHLIGSTTATATGTTFINVTDYADMDEYFNYLTAGIGNAAGTMTVTLTGSCAARKN